METLRPPLGIVRDKQLSRRPIPPLILQSNLPSAIPSCKRGCGELKRFAKTERGFANLVNVIYSLPTRNIVISQQTVRKRRKEGKGI